MFVDLQKKMKIAVGTSVGEGVATILESVINTCEHVFYSTIVQIFRQKCTYILTKAGSTASETSTASEANEDNCLKKQAAADRPYYS